MAKVSLENICKSYGGTSVVRNVSLDIEDGEFVVFVGPSGCGKTTTLRMIAGLESISSGTLKIGDGVMNGVSPSKRNIAMVFQNYALYPHMTVRENMSFGIEERVRDRRERQAKVDEMAAILEITQLLDRYPADMSGGQKQRVALGRALVRNPDVLLMDEPLSNLDARLRVQMRSELKRLVRGTRTTTIFVTHDQVEAMTLGDRVLVLFDGEMQQFDSPRNVYNSPSNTRVGEIIGSPPMNLLRGTIDRRSGRPSVLSDGINIELDGAAASTQALNGCDQVVLGVRPEGLRVLANGAGEREKGIAGEIDLIESQGSETILSIRVGSRNLTARVSPDRLDLKEGLSVLVQLDWSKVGFYHSETGKRLS